MINKLKLSQIISSSNRLYRLLKMLFSIHCSILHVISKVNYVSILFVSGMFHVTSISSILMVFKVLTLIVH